MAKNSLVGNINKRKKAGTSRSKKKSTISDKAYNDQETILTNWNLYGWGSFQLRFAGENIEPNEAHCVKRFFIALALITTQSTQAWAECGDLCNSFWWEKATTSDVKAKLEAGADVMARDMYGDTPLHFAAGNGTPENIQALLEAGADPKAINDNGKTPWDLAQDNNALKDTKGYLALKLAQ